VDYFTAVCFSMANDVYASVSNEMPLY